MMSTNDSLTDDSGNIYYALEFNHEHTLTGKNVLNCINPPTTAPLEPVRTKRKRNKRVLKGETKEFRNARKINNLGINREFVPDLPQCSFNCQNKTSKEERQQVWDEFRAITDMNLRLQYLANLIDIHSPHRTRVPKSSCTKNRSFINKYYLRFNEYLNNTRYQVCKVCFIIVFNITPTKIRTIVRKKLTEGDEMQYNRGKKPPSSSNNNNCTLETFYEPNENLVTMVTMVKQEFPEFVGQSYEISDTIIETVQPCKVKRNKISKKGQTGEFRTARKIKNLGIDREIVPNLPHCSLDCQNRTSAVERQSVWETFRQIVDMNERIKYLANLIQFKPSSHTNEPVDAKKKRSCIPIFHLKWNKHARNLPNRLCKLCFMLVFNLTNSKVRTIVEKKFKNVELEYNRGRKSGAKANREHA